jgi:hypothetical protein
MRLLESIAAAEDERPGPAIRESDVRGLQTLLRNGAIPEGRIFVVQRILAHATGEALGDALPAGDGWSAAAVRAWVERHGGNVTALGRRLAVGRSKLQNWGSESASARSVPPYVQAHMETLDRLAELEGRR